MPKIIPMRRFKEYNLYWGLDNAPSHKILASQSNEYYVIPFYTYNDLMQKVKAAKMHKFEFPDIIVSYDNISIEFYRENRLEDTIDEIDIFTRNISKEIYPRPLILVTNSFRSVDELKKYNRLYHNFIKETKKNKKNVYFVKPLDNDPFFDESDISLCLDTFDYILQLNSNRT